MELYEDENIIVTVPAATARAINVAAAANNKLLILSGDPIMGPFAADGIIAVEPPCPCGNYKIRNTICTCRDREINNHLTDLRIKYATYMWCENSFCFARDIKLKNLDEMGEALLKQAYQEFTPTVMQIVVILKSARAIACMEKSKKIEARHIAEGIAYRLPKD